ncbi:MAG: hypothetical protein ACQUHE_11540 [Bacteroidia bacterium]
MRELFYKILFTLFIVSLTLKVDAQKYIVFERHHGINKHEFIPGLQVSHNEVQLQALDTNLFIFNWYFTPKEGFKWSGIGRNLTSINDDIANQILITAVPLIIPKETLALRKLSLDEYKMLEITSKEQILERTLEDFHVHFTQNKNIMPPLKTLEYGLIIKDKEQYYMVRQKVLVSQFLLRGDDWYFPNEFRSGVLNTNTQIKTYQLNDILAIEKEMRPKQIPYRYLDKIYNRIFVSSINKSQEFNEFVFNFWEYLSDDAVSSLLNLTTLHDFNLGLGSFEFLPNVGIINCTLDACIKKKISYNQKSYFKIRSVNSLSLKDFQNLYKNSAPPNNSTFFNKN